MKPLNAMNNDYSNIQLQATLYPNPSSGSELPRDWYVVLANRRCLVLRDWLTMRPVTLDPTLPDDVCINLYSGYGTTRT